MTRRDGVTLPYACTVWLSAKRIGRAVSGPNGHGGTGRDGAARPYRPRLAPRRPRPAAPGGPAAVLEAFDLGAREWTERHCRVPSGPARGQPIRWHSWQAGILDLIDGDPRVAVLVCSAQSGKSLLAFGLLAHRLARGETCLCVLPDETRSGIAAARRRIERQVQASPLQAIVQEARGVRLGQSGRVALRSFSNAASYGIASAQAPAQLSAVDASTIVGDEISQWPASAGFEGDPTELAIARTDGHRETRTVLFASTPLLPGGHADAWLQAGNVNRWHVTCECGHTWSPTWSDVVDAKVPGIACPECGRIFADGAERVELLQAGRWVPTKGADDPGVQSFHLARWLAPGAHLVDIIADRKRANKKRSLSTWRRLQAAEACEPDSPVDISDLKSRLIPIDSDWPPASVQAIVGGADVQRDHIEVLYMARLVDGRLCVLSYERLRGRPYLANDQAWSKLRQSAAAMKARIVMCDSRYAGDAVRMLARRDRRFKAAVGVSLDRQAMVKASQTSGLLSINVDLTKGIAYERLAADTLLIPADPSFVNDNWLRSLVSEKESIVDGRRRWIKQWTRNEVLDCCGYSIAALELVPHGQARRYRVEVVGDAA